MTIHTQTVEHLETCPDCRKAAAQLIGATGGRKGGKSTSRAKLRAVRANAVKARAAKAAKAEVQP